MAAQPSTVKVVDQSQVAPPPGSVSATTVPLTFFDIPWFHLPPMQRIFIYELPYPALHFMQTVLPHLKESLSLTLSHFFPFAAKLTCPPPPDVPCIVYNEGDAVQVIVAESDVDFNYFIGNHARDVKTLKSLFPKLPVGHLSANDPHMVPTLAIQFTVFPNSGISIGVTYNHAVADGRSIQHFMKSWASIHRSRGEYLTTLSLPYCDRDVVKDPQGLSSILLEALRQTKAPSSVEGVCSENVLITFVIKRGKIEQLKHWITTQSKKIDDELGQVPHMSTFVVTCAFMWIKLMKLQEQIRGYSDDDDMLYHFLSAADCRERFGLSVPGTYFGNCLTQVFVSAKRRELMGEAGIIVAAKAIGRKIFELMGKGAGPGADKWLSNLRKLFEHGRVVTVAGSPKFREYETDFGWGRPKKSEVAHISPYNNFSVCESKDDEGGVDIGVVVGRDKSELLNDLMVD